MPMDAGAESSAKRWTVALTALAGPVGSVGLAFVIGRAAESSAGGMGDLAAVVVALWLGGPILAIIVFVVCLLTLLRETALRRGLAMGVFVVAAIAELLLILIALRFLGGTGESGAWPLVVSGMSVVLLGAGASIALRAAQT